MKPKSATVIGKAYRIKFDHLDGKYGFCDSENCTITINPSADIQQQRDALLHEFIHALDIDMDTRLKERQVLRLATGLIAFLRGNPKVTAWLLKP